MPDYYFYKDGKFESHKEWRGLPRDKTKLWQLTELKLANRHLMHLHNAHWQDQYSVVLMI